MDHGKQRDDDDDRSLRRSMAASISSVTVAPSGGGSHMLATSSSMGNVYNGNSHATSGDFINHESSALSPTSSNANHKSASSSASGGSRVAHTNSACLNNFLFPILTDVSYSIYNYEELEIIVYLSIFQIQRKYSSNSSKNMNVLDIGDLKSVFELAERSRPGVSDLFLKEIIHKLVPGYSETRINNIMDRAIRYVVSRSSTNCCNHFYLILS